MPCPNIFHQSDLNSYLVCPFLFKLKSVLDYPEPGRHPNAVTGSALHWAIDSWHKQGQNLVSKSKCDDIMAEFFDLTIKGHDPVTIAHTDGEIPPVKWEWAKKSREDLLKDAQTILYNYTGQDHNLNANVLLSECDFDVLYHNNHYAGSIDQIRIAPDKSLELVDFKFSSFKPSASYLNQCYQFTLYAYAMRKGSFFVPDPKPDTDQVDHVQIGQLPDRVVWYHLPNLLPYKRAYNGFKKGDLRGDPRFYTTRTLSQVKSGMKHIRKITSLIRNNHFPKAPRQAGSCSGFCRFHEQCLNESDSLPLNFRRETAGSDLEEFFNESF